MEVERSLYQEWDGNNGYLESRKTTNLRKSVTVTREEDVRKLTLEKIQDEPIRKIVESVTKVECVDSGSVHVRSGSGGGGWVLRVNEVQSVR